MALSSRVGRVMVLLLLLVAKATDLGAATARTPPASATLTATDRAVGAARSRLMVKDTVAPSATGVVPETITATGTVPTGAGPDTMAYMLAESRLPSSVQMAPLASQSVVEGSTTVTSPLESGLTLISHRMLPGRSSRRTPTTVPPVTVKAWSRRVT